MAQKKSPARAGLVLQFSYRFRDFERPAVSPQKSQMVESLHVTRKPYHDIGAIFQCFFVLRIRFAIVQLTNICKSRFSDNLTFLSESSVDHKSSKLLKNGVRIAIAHHHFIKSTFSIFGLRTNDQSLTQNGALIFLK